MNSVQQNECKIQLAAREFANAPVLHGLGHPASGDGEHLTQTAMDVRFWNNRLSLTGAALSD
jgi:hypothetical protein